MEVLGGAGTGGGFSGGSGVRSADQIVLSQLVASCLQLKETLKETLKVL